MEENGRRRMDGRGWKEEDGWKRMEEGGLNERLKID